MYFSKSTLLIAFSAFCASQTLAQLDAYKTLSQNDLQENCKKNGIDLSELTAIHTKVEAILNEHIIEMSADEALKTECNSLGSKFENLLKEEMAIVQKCLQGAITLSDDDITTLINQGIKRLCALNHLASYEKSLSTCINADKQLECETEVLLPVEALDNANEFANLGLSYSPEGRKVWFDMFDCTSKALEDCSEEQKKVHLTLTLRMKDTFNTRN